MMKRLVGVLAIAMSGLFVASAGASATPRSIDRGVHSHYASYGDSSTLGDCSVAAAADLEQTIIHRAPSYSAVLTDYRALSPLNNGVTVPDLFSYWESAGIAGHRISGYQPITGSRSQIDRAVVSHRSLIAELQIRATTYGNLGLTITGGAGPIASDHLVAVVGYSPSGLRVVSWGHDMLLSWAYWAKYGEGLWSVSLS